MKNRTPYCRFATNSDLSSVQARAGKYGEVSGSTVIEATLRRLLPDFQPGGDFP